MKHAPNVPDLRYAALGLVALTTAVAVATGSVGLSPTDESTLRAGPAPVAVAPSNDVALMQICAAQRSLAFLDEAPPPSVSTEALGGEAIGGALVATPRVLALRQAVGARATLTAFAADRGLTLEDIRQADCPDIAAP